jgi:central glycolytic genes regulator
MDTFNFSSVQRVVPEFMEVLSARVRILQRILLLQPIGRRALAVEMQTTERVLRSEIDLLRQQGLLVASAAGVSLTEDGRMLLTELEFVVAQVEGRDELGFAVSRILGIPTVVVVAGDSDTTPWVKDHLGYQSAIVLQGLLESTDTLAVTGGSTIATLARMLPVQKPPMPVKVVPARGGVGGTVESQANTIAARLAEKLGGSSIMLHVPDRMSEETLEQLMTDPFVQQHLLDIRHASVVIHGIGDALDMAKRRHASEAELTTLRETGAVAEAFGYYFADDGRVVYQMTTVGLQLSDIDDMRLVMAVVGGARKAEAVAAAAKAYRMDVLVTDEGTARRLIEAHYRH